MARDNDKYGMVAGPWIASGGEMRLPLAQLWPQIGSWGEGEWSWVPAEGFNVFALMQRAEECEYRSPYWITLREGERAGGRLKAGAEGVAVASWRWREKDNQWQGDVEPSLLKQIAPPATEEEGDVAVAMRPQVIFNAQDWEGVALPAAPLRVLPTVQEARARAEAVAARAAGCEIKHTETGAAYYNPSLNYISLPHPGSYASLREYYLALFEQIGHAVASRHQMNLFGGKVDAALAADPSFRTLYARMVAAMLAYETGVEIL